jgi:hypothetical protein
MRQEHMLQWRCAAKSHQPETFHTREEFEFHMDQCHKGTFTVQQLPLLAERSARPIGPTFPSCPLCGETEAKGQLEDHVVGHLRFLALKSLPWPEDVDEDPSSDKTTRPKTRSTIARDPDYGTRPIFDDIPNDSLQRPEDESAWFVDEEAFAGVTSDIREQEWSFITRRLPPYAGHQADPVLRSFILLSGKLLGEIICVYHMSSP